MKSVGRYELLDPIGHGGMAVVYLARQVDLDRQVALKELRVFNAPDDPAQAERFLREARMAGSMSHPNIVTVHEYFKHEGTPYIAMEYLQRGSLRPWVGTMSLAQIAGVLEGLLAALDHAESYHIVHRDLKPENLLVTDQGQVKVADYGIAKARTANTNAFLTAAGTTVGTPTYMAPEQAMAQELGPYTDLYSVGVMAYEMLVGQVPFHDTDTPIALILRHVNEVIPSACTVRPQIDRAISDWIDRLLVKDPAKRTQTAEEAWDELEEYILRLLGSRWRRDARLAGTSDQPLAQPLTPAPFASMYVETPPPRSAPEKVADDFESFVLGAPPAPAAPPAPSAPPSRSAPPPAAAPPARPAPPPPAARPAPPPPAARPASPPAAPPPARPAPPVRSPELTPVARAKEPPAPPAPRREPDSKSLAPESGFLTFAGPRAPAPEEEEELAREAAARHVAVVTPPEAQVVPPPPAQPPVVEPATVEPAPVEPVMAGSLDELAVAEPEAPEKPAFPEAIAPPAAPVPPPPAHVAKPPAPSARAKQSPPDVSEPAARPKQGEPAQGRVAQPSAPAKPPQSPAVKPAAPSDYEERVPKRAAPVKPAAPSDYEERVPKRAAPVKPAAPSDYEERVPKRAAPAVPDKVPTPSALKPAAAPKPGKPPAPATGQKFKTFMARDPQRMRRGDSPGSAKEAAAAPAPPPQEPAKPKVAARAPAPVDAMTIMPNAIPAPAAPAKPSPQTFKRRRAAVIGGVGAAVLVVVVGAVVLGGGGGDGGAPPKAKPAATLALTTDHLSLAVPSAWSKLTDSPAVPGLQDAAAAKQADGAYIAAGLVPGKADPSLLPGALLDDLKAPAPEPQDVTLAGVAAFRYDGLGAKGVDPQLRVYALLTDAGVATIVCASPATPATCDAAADSLELKSAQPVQVGPSAGYTAMLKDAFGGLDGRVATQNKRLDSAGSLKGKASAVARIGQAYRVAAAALGGPGAKADARGRTRDLNPVDAGLNPRLVAAFGDTSSAYRKLARAVRRRDAAAKGRAERAASKAVGSIAAAVKALKRAGYDVAPSVSPRTKVTLPRVATAPPPAAAPPPGVTPPPAAAPPPAVAPPPAAVRPPPPPPPAIIEEGGAIIEEGGSG